METARSAVGLWPVGLGALVLDVERGAGVAPGMGAMTTREWSSATVCRNTVPISSAIALPTATGHGGGNSRNGTAPGRRGWSPGRRRGAGHVIVILRRGALKLVDVIPRSKSRCGPRTDPVVRCGYAHEKCGKFR